ncbi:MAG: hypothetical protein ACYCYP_06820 [Leptospirales bacterium]
MNQTDVQGKIEKIQKRTVSLKEKRAQLKNGSAEEVATNIKALKRIKKALRRGYQKKVRFSKMLSPKTEGKTGEA